MRKLLIASGAALALLFGSPAFAQEEVVITEPNVPVFIKAMPYVTAAGIVGLWTYLIVKKDAPAGSLRAQHPMDPEAYRQYALEPRGGASGPAYAMAFVPAN